MAGAHPFQVRGHEAAVPLARTGGHSPDTAVVTHADLVVFQPQLPDFAVRFFETQFLSRAKLALFTVQRFQKQSAGEYGGDTPHQALIGIDELIDAR